MDDTQTQTDAPTFPPQLQNHHTAAFQVCVVIEGPESDIGHNYFAVKNFTTGKQGEVAFATLVHVSRVDFETQPALKDYPPLDEGENVVDYIARVEKLKDFEWHWVEYQDHLYSTVRGRSIYTYGPNSEYIFVRGDKVVFKATEDKDKHGTVAQFKPRT